MSSRPLERRVLDGPAERNEESAVNVLMDFVSKAQANGMKIKMDHWALRYPTNTEDVARVCHGMSRLTGCKSTGQ
jgi:hypothetical protein